MIERLLQSLISLSIVISALVGVGYASATVLFSDDFSGGSASRWVADQGNWSVINGSYHQQYSDIYAEGLDPALGGRMVSRIAGSNYGDFDATVEAEVVSSSMRERELGITFRAQDLQNYYHLRWYTGHTEGDDHLELQKYTNGTAVVLQLIGVKYIPIDTRLVFKLSARGSQIEAKVLARGGGASSSNQLSVTDTTYTSGLFGLATYHVQGCFDNVVITS
ncbi:MAG: hypothetical protein AABX40_08215 [Candidatus Hydrothermarchaeota archaeon]